MEKDEVEKEFGFIKREKFIEIDGRKHNFDFYPKEQHKNFRAIVYLIDALETVFEKDGYDKKLGLKIEDIKDAFSSSARNENIILMLKKWIRHYQMHIIPKKNYLGKMLIFEEGDYLRFKVDTDKDKTEDDEYVEIGGQKVKLTDKLMSSLFEE
jgi:hypothetical protein